MRLNRARLERLRADQLVGLLVDARRGSARAPAAAAPAYARAVAALELEAARRDLPVPGVHEPMAPSIALLKLESTLHAGDDDGFARVVACLDGPGLWRAYRLALERPRAGARLHALEQVAWQLDLRLNGVHAAGSRRSRFADVPVEGRIAKLRSALDFGFARLFQGRGPSSAGRS